MFEFEWDGRLLKSATKISDNTLIEYDHDSDGKVIYKKVTNPDGSTVTTRMYYSGDTLIQQDITFPDDWGGYATVYAQYIYKQSGFIKEKFGKPIPIIIHDLEYPWYMIEATKNANPHNEADVFFEAMKELGITE